MIHAEPAAPAIDDTEKARRFDQVLSCLAAQATNNTRIMDLAREVERLRQANNQIERELIALLVGETEQQQHQTETEEGKTQ